MHYTEEVTTSEGPIKGIKEENYNLFAGVPYAKPPIGRLRFKKPQTLDKRKNIYLANEFSTKFPQTPDEGFYKKEFYSNPKYAVSLSEDSLYLNIWTPSDAKKGKKYPVAVWIHGGAFEHGYNSEMEFSGIEYAKRGVILVTINYRLGILGFLAHPLLSAENPEHISGNYGLYDQIAALQWIKNNIKNFGGDPHHITLTGQSAGAISVQTLSSSPLTNKLFSAAIMQSGGSYKTGLKYDLTLSQAEKIGEEVFATSNIHSADDLRKIPYEQLLDIYSNYQKERFKDGIDFTNLDTSTPFLLMAPNIDGHLLTKGYDDIIKNNELHHIPYLLGSNKNDLDVNPQHLKNGGLYKGVLAFAKHESQLNIPTYVYYFEHDLPGDNSGAFHSSELWYMFGTLMRSWRPMTSEDKILSIQMIDNWTNFIKFYQPKDEWKPYSSSSFIKTFK